MKKRLKYLSVLFLYIIVSCSNNEETIISVEQYSAVVKTDIKNQINSGIIFSERKHKIGEPSLVKHNNEYHLFYSSESNSSSTEQMGIFYTSATSIDQLNTSSRFPLFKNGIRSPQVFYFTPKKRWYLFADSKIDNSAVFASNSSIKNTEGWTELRKLELATEIGKSYVIADSTDVYLFYSTPEDKLLYRKTEIENFPEGLSDSKEYKTVLLGSYNNNCLSDDIPNIYYSLKDEKYIALMECKKATKNSGTEIKSFTADSLNGQWTMTSIIDIKKDNIYNADGSKANIHTIKNPEILRSGVNQFMEINGDASKIIYQTNITDNKEGRSFTGFSIMMN